MIDSFKTISKPSEETLFKEKGSKFYGYAFPITSEEDVKDILDDLAKRHHTARHFCYAWQLGVENVRYRANDDGEPNNSAGMPIYGQIQSFEVTDILIVSVRYFGGIKLGVGGLISAYKTSAKLAIETSEIINKTITEQFSLEFDYDQMNLVMRIIKEKDLEIVKQEMNLKVNFIIAVRKKLFKETVKDFQQLHKVKTTILEV